MGSKAVVEIVRSAPADTDDSKIERAAEFCHRAFRQSVNAILECGQKLAALKAELKDGGRWMAAFGQGKGRKQIGPNPFPFSCQTADQIIVSYERFGRGASRLAPLQLPPSWTTLYELSQIPDERLEQVKDKITPSMTRAQAKALKSDKPPASKKKVAVKKKKRVSGEPFTDEEIAFIRSLNNDDMRRVLTALYDLGWVGARKRLEKLGGGNE